MALEEDTRLYFVGDVKKFKITVTKGGGAWALTSVVMKLVNPSGTITSNTCSQEDADTWYFTTLTTTLDVPGRWRRYFVCSDGSSVATVGDYDFTVRAVT